ncbi:hypothetical protein QTI66_02025 [Variovorax sp. J22R133]|uniref:hypothetical protein n=1 Tax=Variovorax brevis TaxID=3053503 RepID=UPI002575FDB5|nr:hypothetical protein [Variovorax sp. J22R133]MDM0110904.1 hypothetical protein [Variovorax sp. J22R133]
MDFTAFRTDTEIRVHLAPHALIACELQRRWRKTTVIRKASFDFIAGERAAAMDQLQAWIGDTRAERTITWVVGPTEALYFTLPWSPEWVDRSVRDSFARERFEQLFERDARTAAFCFADPSPDGGQLVSCISIELHAEIVAHAKRSRCTLGGIKPSIAAVWNRFRDVLETEEGTLCVIDGDRQTIVRHDRSRIKDIVVKPCTQEARAAASRAGVFRRFTNVPAGVTTGQSADLQLPTRRGFVATQDAAWAFALCGAL